FMEGRWGIDFYEASVGVCRTLGYSNGAPIVVPDSDLPYFTKCTSEFPHSNSALRRWGLALPELRVNPIPSRGFGMHTDSLTIPLWLPFLVIATPTALLWYRDRRRRIPAGHCQKCAYDLTGNVSGVCPECGMACG